MGGRTVTVSGRPRRGRALQGVMRRVLLGGTADGQTSPRAVGRVAVCFRFDVTGNPTLSEMHRVNRSGVGESAKEFDEPKLAEKDSNCCLKRHFESSQIL